MSSQHSALRLTPRAERLLQLANSHALRLNHNLLGTEHLLLGLASLREGRAISILDQMGIDLAELRARLEKEIEPGPSQGARHEKAQLTPRVEQVLALAAREAKAFHRDYAGTEDILLGIVSEGEGIAARLLHAAGVEAGGVRQAVRERSLAAAEAERPADSDWPNPSTVAFGFIESEKTYDVYCQEKGEDLTVYSGVRFKGVRKLFSTDEAAELSPEYVELENADGKVIYICSSCILKFHEPGMGFEGRKVEG
jgi:ATP-dependent Clp protease ATP-binding subunit ClpA